MRNYSKLHITGYYCIALGECEYLEHLELREKVYIPDDNFKLSIGKNGNGNESEKDESNSTIYLFIYFLFTYLFF